MNYIVKSAVRRLLKGKRASPDFFKALNKKIEVLVKDAITRATKNGRKTLRGYDL